MNRQPAMVHVKAPDIRVAKETPWGSPPPESTVIESVLVTATRRGHGYVVSVDVTGVRPGSRPGFLYQDISYRSRTSMYRAWPVRPTTGALLRAVSRYAWDMSISEEVLVLEGQEPLPGL